MPSISAMREPARSARHRTAQQAVLSATIAHERNMRQTGSPDKAATPDLDIGREIEGFHVRATAGRS
ncbi:hypothetical protein [Streptomyces sp. NPDC058440]|uniref:hypothetical protein n=1 Tax=unclassified Streptomyces TaxID=2593676 RepID=UPI003663C630